GGSGTPVHRVAVAAAPDDPRGGGDVRRRHLLRDRGLPVWSDRRSAVVLVTRRVPLRALQRRADAPGLSDPSSYLRTIPTPTGGAVLDGEINLSPEGLGDPRGADVRGADHAPVVPAGARVGVGDDPCRPSVCAVRGDGRDPRPHLRRPPS